MYKERSTFGNNLLEGRLCLQLAQLQDQNHEDRRKVPVRHQQNDVDRSVWPAETSPKSPEQWNRRACAKTSSSLVMAYVFWAAGRNMCQSKFPALLGEVGTLGGCRRMRFD